MQNLDYGIIGNCKSAALVSKTGSIDWCCLPEFNSSSIFAKLLDKDKGGSIEFIVDESYTITQQYLKKTNLLLTRFSSGNDCFEVIDFMPRYNYNSSSYYAPPDIVRYIQYVSGEPVFKIKYNPKLEFAVQPTFSKVDNGYIKSKTTKGTYDSLYLYSSLDLGKILNGDKFTLVKDEYLLISYNQKLLQQTTERAYVKMEKTKVYWLSWCEKIKGFSMYNNEIIRSSLVLKLLTFDKTGAVLAALTTSLPETIGEVRNWDYRFCWLRDASMVIKIMTELGQINTAQRYLQFLLAITPDKDEKIQIMYGIKGEKRLTEQILEHLSGYENSAPVRVGNAAYLQKQNDIYGFLMDVILQQFQFMDTSLEEAEALWTITRSVIKIVSNNWQKPDRGIWEFRTEKKHFTFSKLLCWVAVDRGVKIAELINRQDYAREWGRLRAKIAKDISENSWSDEKQAFTQAYGTNDLDASTLLMEPYGFIDASDPKYISTVKATQKELSHNGLMYRYKNKDDFGLPKSSFTICSFWFINALFKIGEKKQAKKLFEQLLSYSNHVGIFSEDIDFETKRLLGNIPQAYSHLALIETAIAISEGSITDEEQILEAIHEVNTHPAE